MVRKRTQPIWGRPAAPVAVALFVVALLATGCSSSGGTAASPTSRPTASTGAASQSELAKALVGRYAHYDVVAYEDKAMKTLIISTGFSDLELRAGQLWNVMRFCHADVGSDQKLDISISDAATRAIVPIATPVQVTEVNGKLRVVRPATPTAIGIHLKDPAHEKLPIDPKDPRIFDADGDGHPGVTSNVKVSDALRGEIYLARREIFAYDVTQTTPDRLVGTVKDRSEQLILGANNPVFLVKAQWKQIADPERNPVIWHRVGADWDCARLAKARAKIFPPEPKVNW